MQSSSTRDSRAGPEDSDSNTGGASQSQNKRNKRFQACVACRATKTKCLPTDQADSCQACQRSNRPCIMPGPAKPRIKSAQKFSELEKKIELLTNALAGREGGLQGTSDSTTTQRNPTSLQPPLVSENSPDSVEHEGNLSHRDTEFTINLSSQIIGSPDRTRLDVFEEGLIERDLATNLFNHWNNNMRFFMPLISLSSDSNPEYVRKNRPILYLAILTVASASVYPPLAPRLVARLTHELGRQVFVQGSQSIDLILATLLFSTYYFSPRTATNLAPTQYIYAAVAMSSDLGLHAKAKTITAAPMNITSGAIEAARVCLAEWFIASVTATLLHRNTLVRHNPDLDRYAQLLQNEREISENYLSSLVRLQQIKEGASLLLDSSETRSETAFDEPATQYKMNMLQRQLENWEIEVPASFDTRLKQHGYHTTYVQIHHLAVRCYIRKMTMSKRSKPSDSSHTDAMSGLTPVHFDCLTKCLTSTKALLDIYLSFDLSLARCLPNSYAFWNINAALLLIKLGHFDEVLSKLNPQTAVHSSAGGSLSYQPTVVNYLDAIANKLDEVSQDGYLPQAKSYVRVLRKLKSYYLQKRAACLTSQGDAVPINHEDDEANVIPGHGRNQTDQVMTGFLPSSTGHALPSGRLESMHGNIHQHSQRPSGAATLPHDGWSPSTTDYSQASLRTPMSEPYGDQFSSPNMSILAAHDPSVYASTDWNALNMDPVSVEHLDSFLWAEQDTAWMQTLL